ncbi:glycosyltransferase family 2 protein [Candidatus Daviesbacteria bacterium]|nr:glycosyltransferase family 2 protein [Candidatus Daviesbacteria bacterium]
MKKVKKWPKVTVVISNYNGLKLNLLTEAVSSIFKNNYPNLEVILVDNASTDESVEVAGKKFPKLKIIKNPVNMYSQGLNLGIKNSTGEYIAFFNNDVVVENGYFQEFIKFLDNNKDIALSQGKLLSYFDHQIIDSAGETIDPFGTPITIGAGMSADNFNAEKEVLSVSGSCSILRKASVESVGLFDEDFGIGYEDLDLALRAWSQGFRVVYFPKVSAFHRRGATDLSDMVRIKVRWHFNKNRIITLIKNYPVPFLLKNLPVTIFIYFTAGLWEIIIKRKINLGLTRFTSLLWVALHLNDIFGKRKKVQSKAKKAGKEMITKLLYDKAIVNSFDSFIRTK